MRPSRALLGLRRGQHAIGILGDGAGELGPDRGKRGEEYIFVQVPLVRGELDQNGDGKREDGGLYLSLDLTLDVTLSATNFLYAV
jgi:hypothetical protein